MGGWNAHRLWEEEDARHQKEKEQAQREAWAAQVQSIPDEVWVEVLRRVEPSQLLRVRAVNRRFRRLAEDGALWAYWATTRWGADCQARSPAQYFGWVRHHAYTRRQLEELGQIVERMRQDEARAQTQRPPLSLSAPPQDPRTPVRCRRCGKSFVGALNHAAACHYHALPYHHTLQHWPCCQLSRASQGCQQGSHAPGSPS